MLVVASGFTFVRMIPNIYAITARSDLDLLSCICYSKNKDCQFSLLSVRVSTLYISPRFYSSRKWQSFSLLLLHLACKLPTQGFHSRITSTWSLNRQPTRNVRSSLQGFIEQIHHWKRGSCRVEFLRLQWLGKSICQHFCWWAVLRRHLTITNSYSTNPIAYDHVLFRFPFFWNPRNTSMPTFTDDS